MTEFSSVSLKIETVGAAEALKSLDSLDRAGRRIVESVAGNTGRALGDVASAYRRAGDAGRDAFREVALRADMATESVKRVTQQTEGLGQRSANSAVSIARAFETMERTGRVTGRSLDTLLAQTSQIAFQFGATGAVVGAIAIGTAAIVEMFQRAGREAERLAAETAKEIEKIYSSGSYSAGADRVAELYNGNPFAADQHGRLSIQGLKARKKQLEDLSKPSEASKAGAGYGQVAPMNLNERAYREELEKVNKALKERTDLYDGLTKKGGVMEALAAKQVASDQAGFRTDQLREQEKQAEKTASALARLRDAVSLRGDAASEISSDGKADTWLAKFGLELERVLKSSPAAEQQIARLRAAAVQADREFKDAERKRTADAEIAREAKATETLVEQAKATREETAALLSGESARRDYTVEQKARLETEKALLIVNTAQRELRLLAIAEDLAAGRAKNAAMAPKNKLSPSLDWSALVEQIKEGRKTIDEAWADLGAGMQKSIQKTMGDALSKGIEATISQKSLGAGFKTLTATMLSGIGDMMISVGKSMVTFGTFLDEAIKGLIALNGGSVVAAGLELIAVGAILKSAAGGISSSIGGGSSSSGYGAVSGGAAGFAQVIDRSTISPGAYSSNATPPSPRPSISAQFVTIGPSDPNAQRAIDEILRKINQRGSLA